MNLRPWCAWFLTLLLSAVSAAALTVVEPRCDWAVNPLGVDSATPHLTWKLDSPDRGARQSAYQIRVASSPDLLVAEVADVWDSGHVPSDAQIQIAYLGRPLATGERVFWQVRVWDAQGRVSAWSPTANWTMGIVAPADWKAQWITDPALDASTRRKLGYSSPPTENEHTPQSLVLDLGAEHPVERIVLHAVVHTVNERLGFPRWFTLELARSPDFSDAVTVADHTADPINPWFRQHAVAVDHVPARYLRLSAPRLRLMDEAGDGRLLGRLALSQIEVNAAGRNVAPGARVNASASLEDERWSAQAVVDGLALPGGHPHAAGTLRLRREFPTAAGLRRAVLFVSGLGHYTLQVNGRTVGGADLLKPGWTDPTRTVLYDTYDVTDALRTGDVNAIGLTLAGGMYHVPAVPGRYTKFVGPPRALKALAQLQLEYEDGRIQTVVTDDSWRTAPGPVTFAHIYGGEDFDARRAAAQAGWTEPGFNASNWTAATTTAAPGGVLRGFSHAGPPLRTHEELTPVATTTLGPAVRVYDLGQNTALLPTLRVRGPAGATVKIRPAELVRADGTIDTASIGIGKSEAAWNYTLAGDPDGEFWAPEFFYHGARYLQVELTAPEGGALPVVEAVTGRVFHSSAPAVGHFASANPLLNRIRELIRWAQRSNMMHVLTDCPHRERLGWLEQYHLNGPALRYEWDVTRLYAKTFQDMADAQLDNGLIPSIAPEYVRFEGYFRDSPEWGSALILAPAQQLAWTGDDAPLRTHYPAMRRYFDFLRSRRDFRGLVNHGLGDWYDLGPERPGVAQLTPVALVATATTFEDALALDRIAQHLARPDDARLFRAAAAELRIAFNAAFLDYATGTYATGSQTAQAMPLALGLVPDDQSNAVLARLLEAVAAAGDATTAGDVGHRYFLNALAQTEHSNLIYRIVNQTERPGYGYQLACGATSLTESWDADRRSSHNHFMLGHLTEWLYGQLAGLAPDPAYPGFAHAWIRPSPVAGLDWAEASLETVRGPFAVRWERGANPVFRLEVTVPANAGATVLLPRELGGEGAITESGRPVTSSPGVTPLEPINGRAAFRIGAGRYRFEVR